MRDANALSRLRLLEVGKLTTNTRHRAQALLPDLFHDLLPKDTARLSALFLLVRLIFKEDLPPIGVELAVASGAISGIFDESLQELAHLHYAPADALPVDRLRPAFLFGLWQNLRLESMPLAGCDKCGERCAQTEGVGRPGVARCFFLRLGKDLE